MADDHPCHCYVCAPEAFPAVPQGAPDSQYLAAGFTGCVWRRVVPSWAVRPAGRTAYALVNGERVGAALEVYAGVVGWVVAIRGRAAWPIGPGTSHQCPCGSGSACLEVLRGYVEIRHDHA